MRNSIQFSLIAILMLTASCASLPSLQSSWSNEGTVHNCLGDKEANIFFPEDELVLKLSNDKDYLDIVVETNSALTLNRIYNLGLSIWLDPQGKNSRVFGVNFPLPVEKPYSRIAFQDYISRFDTNKLQEEFFDRFQKYEYEDVRLKKNISVSTLDDDDVCQVCLNTSNQVLFTCHLRIALKEVMGANFKLTGDEKIGLSIFSTNLPTQAYRSSLSSKEVINERLKVLTAGDNPKRQELVEKWVQFNLSTQK